MQSTPANHNSQHGSGVKLEESPYACWFVFFNVRRVYPYVTYIEHPISSPTARLCGNAKVAKVQLCNEVADLFARVVDAPNYPAEIHLHFPRSNPELRTKNQIRRKRCLGK